MDLKQSIGGFSWAACADVFIRFFLSKALYKFECPQ